MQVFYFLCIASEISLILKKYIFLDKPPVLLHDLSVINKHFQISQLLKKNSVKFSPSVSYISCYSKAKLQLRTFDNKQQNNILKESPGEFHTQLTMHASGHLVWQMHHKIVQ